MASFWSEKCINPVLLFMTLFCSRCFVTDSWECVYYAIIVLWLCSHESLCNAVQLTVFSIWKLHWNFILARSVNCIFELLPEILQFIWTSSMNCIVEFQCNVISITFIQILIFRHLKLICLFFYKQPKDSIGQGSISTLLNINLFFK